MMCIYKSLVLEVLDVYDSPDLVVGRNLYQILDRPTLAAFISFRNLIHIEPVAPAFFRKEQHGMVCRGNEEVFDIILFAGPPPDGAAASPALLPVFGSGSPFDI